MERKVTKLENCHVEVVVTVDEKSWKDAQKKAFDKLAANVSVPGFRKGKAPENLVKARVEQVKVFDEAINKLIPDIYQDIMKNEDIRPMAQPKVDVTKLSETELEIKFVMVTAPEVKLGAYKDLKIGHEEVKVTKKDIDDAINANLQSGASLIVKDDVSVKGDTVVMDFVGKVDGKPFDGGSAENYELELGSGSFIPGFEDQLIGHKAGETVEVNVTFPENYVENLKGKAAVFTCTIHEVKEKKLPELDADFVKEMKLPGVETVDQFKEYKKNELQKQKEDAEKRTYIGKVIDAIQKDSKCAVADEIIESQVESRKKDMEARMAQNGLTLEQYLQVVGQKEEDFMKKLKEDATNETIRYFLLNEIAVKEDLIVSDEEIEFEYAKIAEQYKMEIANVKKALEPQKESFRQNILMNRVDDFLIKNNQ